MYKSIFTHIKKRIPKISSTEMVALTSGGTSIDRQILQGNVCDLPKPLVKLDKFPKNILHHLLTKFDHTKIYPNENNNRWIQYLAKNKFFSFLIDEEYGGIKLSTMNSLIY